MAKENSKEVRRAPAGSRGGLYLYCVGEREALTYLFGEEKPPPIEPGGGLVLVEGSRLSAVTSEVDLADYGEDVLSERMTDATWVAVRAMRHEKVVEHFARRTSVVPVRFGAIYLERENVELMLAEREEELLAVIERLRGSEEWGLNVYCDRAELLEKVTSLSPVLREMSERAGAAAPGQAYLLRKKIESLREGEARAETRRVAERIEAELAACSRAAARLRVLKDEGGEHGELTAKLAFLVERSGFGGFRSAAERLAEEYAGAGFRLELTGPWPAYNFAAAV